MSCFIRPTVRNPEMQLAITESIHITTAFIIVYLDGLNDWCNHCFSSIHTAHCEPQLDFFFLSSLYFFSIHSVSDHYNDYELWTAETPSVCCLIFLSQTLNHTRTVFLFLAYSLAAGPTGRTAYDISMTCGWSLNASVLYSFNCAVTHEPSNEEKE